MTRSTISLPNLKIVPGLLAQFGRGAVAAGEVRLNLYAVAGEENAGRRFDILISLTIDPENPQEGITSSRLTVKHSIADQFPDCKVEESQFYLQTEATEAQIRTISQMPGVDMVWENKAISGHLLTSVETIRASAGWRTFEARGEGITWAVLDTGVQAGHPHFSPLGTIDHGLSKSFVGADPLMDTNGHGTHVAGIIAGFPPAVNSEGNSIEYTVDALYEDNLTHRSIPLDRPPSGVAPRTRLISVQVLRGDGGGTSFDCIRGLEYIRNLNQNSRQLRVDGANLSLGYDLDAQTYGCGHSPICEEVNRCVDAGICVVVSCGNSGYGVVQTVAAGAEQQQSVGVAVSISDPANADLCIAVGSTHKQAPHRYGISYFSSKGPTLDGRRKPDLVAPGEKVYSCNSKYDGVNCHDAYVEMSGTSMAAPHVSGAIAAFLSVRPDFRGDPREVKKIFRHSAMDLGREPAYQGYGFVDVFKALLSG